MAQHVNGGGYDNGAAPAPPALAPKAQDKLAEAKAAPAPPEEAGAAMAASPVDAHAPEAMPAADEAKASKKDAAPATSPSAPDQLPSVSTVAGDAALLPTQGQSESREVIASAGRRGDERPGDEGLAAKAPASKGPTMDSIEETAAVSWQTAAEEEPAKTGPLIDPETPAKADTSPAVTTPSPAAEGPTMDPIEDLQQSVRTPAVPEVSQATRPAVQETAVAVQENVQAAPRRTSRGTSTRRRRAVTVSEAFRRLSENHPRAVPIDEAGELVRCHLLPNCLGAKAWSTTVDPEIKQDLEQFMYSSANIVLQPKAVNLLHSREEAAFGFYPWRARQPLAEPERAAGTARFRKGLESMTDVREKTRAHVMRTMVTAGDDRPDAQHQCEVVAGCDMRKSAFRNRDVKQEILEARRRRGAALTRRA